MVDYTKSITERETKNFGCYGTPHPDGQPWKKSCGVCACAKRHQDDGGKRSVMDICSIQNEDCAKALADGCRFFCIHRQDDGFVRACASFDKINSGPNKYRHEEDN
jgi:hypothetical protein